MAAMVMTLSGIGIAQQSNPYDSDGDGIPNYADQCPYQPGSPPDGCPNNGPGPAPPSPGPNPGPTPNSNDLSQKPPSSPPSQQPNPEQPDKLFSKPPGAGSGKLRAVGTPVMYVNGFGQTNAGVMVYGNAGLYVQGQGQIQVVEYVWTGWNWNYHDQALRFNPGPSNWASFWFFGDYVGATPGGTWHALRAYVGGVPTNWVYIFVVGG